MRFNRAGFVVLPSLGRGGQFQSSATLSLWGWNAAFHTYPGLTLGAAAMIAARGTQEQISKYALRMFSGERCGTMCLTEPVRQRCGQSPDERKAAAGRHVPHHRDEMFHLLGETTI